MNLIKDTKTWLWVCGILLALILYDLGLRWWSSFPPKRPSTVSPEAVFVFAPFKGDVVPVPKKGDWLNCWLDSEHNLNRCRMSDADGILEYEGVFSPSQGSSPVPDIELKIDIKRTGTRMQWVYFRDQIMPIIHLIGGTILIPTEASEPAKQTLEWQREHQGH
jgi:hypothetical protein